MRCYFRDSSVASLLRNDGLARIKGNGEEAAAENALTAKKVFVRVSTLVGDGNLIHFNFASLFQKK